MSGKYVGIPLSIITALMINHPGMVMAQAVERATDYNESAEKLDAMDQGQNKDDVAITQAIRKALVSDENLTVSGKNVKVITRDGKVTLRGMVGSPAERQTIENIANAVVANKYMVYSDMNIISK